MQIVDLLGRLWIMFDDVIAKYNVYKVSSARCGVTRKKIIILRRYLCHFLSQVICTLRRKKVQ